MCRAYTHPAARNRASRSRIPGIEFSLAVPWNALTTYETAMSESSSSFGSHISYVNSAVSLSEVISAMTFALDLTDGAVPGHSLRSCLLGMRIAEAMNIPEEMRASLYYALQLKDTGCSDSAARMTRIVGGSDREANYIARLSDWARPYKSYLRTLRTLSRHILPTSNLLPRVARFARIGLAGQKNHREMIRLRCERGAEIVRKLEMGELAAEAVRCIDEHWDGSGYPNGLKGREIPLLARICSVAQNLDIFATEDGTRLAMAVIRQRSGAWFDPQLVRVAESLCDTGALWVNCRVNDGVEATRRAVLELDPGMRTQLVPERVDRICEAFASVVDAKSPYTYRHSMGVAEVAVEIATEMGLSQDRIQLVRRAALLHDIGKLYVPASILDKPGKLSPHEWEVMLEHPKVTRSILERVSSFRELAAIAAEHHEKLDGSGYPLQLTAKDMSTESRVVAMADTFAALAEKRPYRNAIAPQEILEMLAPDIPTKYDAACFAALCAVAERMPQKLMTASNPGIPLRDWPAKIAPAI